MTSKEALGKIRDYHNETVYDVDNIYTENMFEKELDIIEKDLEVLEIIKKYITFSDYHYNDKDQNCIDILIPESDENYRVIKEWLTNDCN